MATATSSCRYDLNTVNGKSLTPLYSFTKTDVEVDEKEVDALLNSNRLRKKRWFYKDNTYINKPIEDIYSIEFKCILNFLYS